MVKKRRQARGGVFLGYAGAQAGALQGLKSIAADEWVVAAFLANGAVGTVTA